MLVVVRMCSVSRLGVGGVATYERYDTLVVKICSVVSTSGGGDVCDVMHCRNLLICGFHQHSCVQ